MPSIEWIAGIVFGAGIAWGVLRQTRKDVNGLGARHRKFEKNMLLYLGESGTDEQRKRLTDLFKE